MHANLFNTNLLLTSLCRSQVHLGIDNGQAGCAHDCIMHPSEGTWLVG